MGSYSSQQELVVGFLETLMNLSVPSKVEISGVVK
jgi:hypothetical protein